MLKDSQYLQKHFTLSEIPHHYGTNVHLVGDPYLFTLLSILGHPATKQPLINQLLNSIYREMVKYVVNHEFVLKQVSLETRMSSMHTQGVFEGLVIDREHKVVSVNLARAGTVPSQICFDAFNYVFNPDGVRQDHISINRKTDDDESVIGTNLGGVKIGGSIDDSTVVIPDPMGATGSTLVTVLDIYKNEIQGTARKYIAIHLIVTPEYLKRVTQTHPELIVYAIRLDRGLSEPEILKSPLGKYWDKERGLNDKQYIVPGAGGVGEVINNSYV